MFTKDGRATTTVRPKNAFLAKQFRGIVAGTDHDEAE
jgi:hypothetical protein